MMRSILVVGLLAVVLVLLFQIHTQSLAIKSLQQAAAASPPVPSLETQDKCAKQAAAEYRQEGLENKSMAEFTNHYSAKLGRCFVVTKNTSASGNVISTQKLLVDAYEGKTLGTYDWLNNGKPFWQVVPSECSVTFLDGNDRTCKSSEEWDAWSKHTWTPHSRVGPGR